MKARAHQIKPHDLPLQRNALRVEAITPGPVCVLRPKVDQSGRRYEVRRWVGSGGDPAAAAMPCVGWNSRLCPCRVIADDSPMSGFKRGPCPVCRTMNRRDGYGTVACRDCGLLFALVAESKEPSHRQNTRLDASHGTTSSAFC